MSFSIDATDILEPTFNDYYQSTCNIFHEQIERLYVSKYIVFKIKDYPVKEILFDRDNIAIQLILQNFIDICILIISRLLNDNTSDLLSLYQFKNEILSHIINEELRTKYNQYLKETIKNKEIHSTSLKLKKIRDWTIAHYKRVYFVNNEYIDSINWSDINDLVNYINIFFNALQFNSGFLTMNTIAYHPEITSSNLQRPDIDKIIEKYEDESPIIINLENYPHEWEYISENYNEKEIEKIKEIIERRKKI